MPHRLGMDPAKITFIKPGEFWFGAAPAQVSTILGSCVAIILWHPKRRIGGICHYLVPQADLKLRPDCRGHTAGEAMALFLRELRRLGTEPTEYQVKVFGGASFFTTHSDSGVAAQNVAAARQLLADHGFRVECASVGGRASRKLVFDVATGDVWLSSISAQAS